jgi:ubiquinone/menaquinone biosynthesis C-methylase UbiE
MESDVDAVRREYDSLATVYDRRWRHYVKVTLRAIVERVPFQGQECVLDIACGTGELERLLLSRWPELRIVGADVSLGMLRQAALKHRGKQVVWVQADAAHLPFPDQSFDYAICANSFHYFHSPIQSLHEVQRVLRPQGVFVLDDWCDDYWSCKLCSLWLRWTEPAFYRTYSMRALRSLLEQSGFEVIHADCFRVGIIWGMMHFISRRRARDPS